VPKKSVLAEKKKATASLRPTIAYAYMTIFSARSRTTIVSVVRAIFVFQRNIFVSAGWTTVLLGILVANLPITSASATWIVIVALLVRAAELVCAA